MWLEVIDLIQTLCDSSRLMTLGLDGSSESLNLLLNLVETPFSLELFEAGLDVSYVVLV